MCELLTSVLMENLREKSLVVQTASKGGTTRTKDKIYVKLV